MGLGRVSFPLWSQLPPLSLWKVEGNTGTQQELLTSYQSQEFMRGNSHEAAEQARVPEPGG